MLAKNASTLQGAPALLAIPTKAQSSALAAHADGFLAPVVVDNPSKQAAPIRSPIHATDSGKFTESIKRAAPDKSPERAGKRRTIRRTASAESDTDDEADVPPHELPKARAAGTSARKPATHGDDNDDDHVHESEDSDSKTVAKSKAQSTRSNSRKVPSMHTNECSCLCSAFMNMGMDGECSLRCQRM